MWFICSYRMWQDKKSIGASGTEVASFSMAEHATTPAARTLAYSQIPHTHINTHTGWLGYVLGHTPMQDNLIWNQVTQNLHMVAAWASSKWRKWHPRRRKESTGCTKQDDWSPNRRPWMQTCSVLTSNKYIQILHLLCICKICESYSECTQADLLIHVQHKPTTRLHCFK